MCVCEEDSHLYTSVCEGQGRMVPVGRGWAELLLLGGEDSAANDKKTKVKEERDACGGEGRRCGCRVEVVEEVRSAEGLLNLTGIHPGRGAEEHSSDVRAAKAAGMR